ERSQYDQPEYSLDRIEDTINGILKDGGIMSQHLDNFDASNPQQSSVSTTMIRDIAQHYAYRFRDSRGRPSESSLIVPIQAWVNTELKSAGQQNQDSLVKS